MGLGKQFPEVGETINDYFLESLLSNTSESTRIYIAISQSLHSQVVIKVILLTDNDNHYIDEESDILREVNSPYVLKALDIFDIDYPIDSTKNTNKLRFIVTPKIGEKDALSFTQKYDYVKYIIYDVLKALQYLHNMNIVHRDIKPENIFVEYLDEKKPPIYLGNDSFEKIQNKTEDNFSYKQSAPIHAVLGDLGFAKRYPSNQIINETEEYVGTLQYCSPQVAIHLPCMFI